ncbi:IclR family transcriptional regulator [Halomonas salipaludis]|uniref:IclR family transcriptional regulator n=1 Tax=Halomonas salipaludis TaxID=2032625 RepID=A0A2A2EPJ2_9GAMM|nr:IclR family transcriptional regulator [Halomonas salipaludis]PAU74578.1 IclR family transcriptional regulator [Halomonas salipaludis]
MTRKEPDAGRSALFNQSIEKAFSLLGLFDAHHGQLSLSQLVELSGMSMGSVQRITHTLQQLGYLERVPGTRKYRIGIKIMTVAAKYLETDLLVDCANPYLSDLSNRCLETVSLTEPSGNDMVYVARFTSRHYIPIHMPIGSSVPMYCTASGRAFLSVLPETVVRGYLESTELLEHTPDTVTDIDALVAIIQECRTQGVAWNNAEFFIGDLNVAAPVLNAVGEPVAAVHITAPTSRWTLPEALKQLGPPLVECARAITKAARTRAR